MPKAGESLPSWVDRAAADMGVPAGRTALRLGLEVREQPGAVQPVFFGVVLTESSRLGLAAATGLGTAEIAPLLLSRLAQRHIGLGEVATGAPQVRSGLYSEPPRVGNKSWRPRGTESLNAAQQDQVKRLGRAVVFVHQHEHKISDSLVRAEVEVLLLTGRAMDLAVRLRGHRGFVPLTHELVVGYARHAGIGPRDLLTTVLPALKNANLIDYRVDAAGRIAGLDEYIGVSASLTEQTVQLLNVLRPTRADVAFLHSVEVGAIAPLAESQHLQEIVKRGFTDVEAAEALRLSRAAKINLKAGSVELNEDVIYSPYVWGTKQLSLAKFLKELPPNERDALLGMSEQVLSTPGLHMSKLAASPGIVRSAQNAGLIQAATVKSATGASSTYVFSPLLEAEDNLCTTTEAFHLRKLFVAHILFGHEKAMAGLGKIGSPAVLVDRLVNRGRVGPATNIGTDYYMLEAAGVVAVEPQGDRAFLRLVKPEIAKAGLEWIKRITDPTGDATITLGQRPTAFVKPEDSRLDGGEDPASHEILAASINELRKEMQRAARRDDPWS